MDKYTWIIAFLSAVLGLALGWLFGHGSGSGSKSAALLNKTIGDLERKDSLNKQLINNQSGKIEDLQIIGQRLQEQLNSLDAERNQLQAVNQVFKNQVESFNDTAESTTADVGAILPGIHILMAQMAEKQNNKLDDLQTLVEQKLNQTEPKTDHQLMNKLSDLQALVEQKLNQNEITKQEVLLKEIETLQKNVTEIQDKSLSKNEIHRIDFSLTNIEQRLVDLFKDQKNMSNTEKTELMAQSSSNLAHAMSNVKEDIGIFNEIMQRSNETNVKTHSNLMYQIETLKDENRQLQNRIKELITAIEGF